MIDDDDDLPCAEGDDADVASRIIADEDARTLFMEKYRLSAREATLLTTPIAKIPKNFMAEALAAKDKVATVNRAERDAAKRALKEQEAFRD